ncbi:MAG: iron ABC transporter permease [Candidatus Binatia bacterium]
MTHPRNWLLRVAPQDPQRLIILCVGLLIAYLSLSPTVMLLYGSFRSEPLGVPGEFSLSYYIEAYTDPLTYELLLNSLIFAAGSSILAVILATALAWITVRTNAPLRRTFELTAIIPNIFPPIMLAVAWTLLLGPRIGLINVALMGLLGLEIAPFDIYSMTGMIFVEGLITTPLAFLIISAGFYSMDPSLEESARVAGSNNFQIAWRITFPITRPAILAAITLNFVRAVESFDTPAIIAIPARIEVFTTKIFREAIDAYPPNHSIAATYAVSLLTITIALVYIYRRLTVRSERYVTVTGRGYRPTLIDLGRWRYMAAGIAGSILFLIVVLPFAVLIYGSVVSYIHVPTEKTLSLLTLEHYTYNMTDPRTYKAIKNSLFLAVTGATLCMLLASITAYIIVKTKTAGRGIIEALTFLPWAFPGAALAIGLLWVYIYIPLPIYSTIWIILIGYITRFLPYGLRSMTSTIVQIHNELEDASKISGAGFLQTFRRILLPLMKPGFIAGWIILATIYLREFSISVFLYAPSAEPIGPLLYHFFIDGEIGPMCSLAVVVSVISMALIVVARRLGKIGAHY